MTSLIGRRRHSTNGLLSLPTRWTSWSVQRSARHVRPCSCARRDLLVWPQPGQTCFRRLCSMFLLASTSASSMVTGRRIREDACPRLCHSPGRLLQHGTRWCTEVCHWQTAVGIERCCTSCQRNAQVRPLAVADATCRLALARCGRWSSVHARRHSPPVSPQQGAEVPDSLVVSLSWISLVVSDCAQHSSMYRAIDEGHSAVGRFLSLDQPSGIRFQSCSEKRLKTLSSCHWKRFSDNISVFRALEFFYDNALYKSTFYFITYLLVGGIRWLTAASHSLRVQTRNWTAEIVTIASIYFIIMSNSTPKIAMTLFVN